MAVSRYFNVTNPPKLLEDLEEDPFINFINQVFVMSCIISMGCI